MATPLKLEKEKRKLSTTTIAAAVGVSQATISRIENAKARPSLPLANRLAKYFNNAVTRDQILYPEDYIETGGRKPTQRRQLQKAS